MIEPIRLLAFAFAGADLLFEVNREGTILFATGAPSAFSDSTELVGTPASALFLSNEQSRFAVIARGLTPGERVGPLPMTLASGEKVSLAMCFLPLSDRISCTLVKPGRRGAFAGSKDAETGLMDRAAFAAAAAENAGGRGALAMVDAPGLPEICAKLPTQEAAGLMASIGANLKAMGAIIAARLSQTAFGIVTEDPQAARRLGENIQSAVSERGLERLRLDEVTLSLKGRNLTAEQNVLALRHVVGRFAEGNIKGLKRADLADVFNTMMEETLIRAQEFTTTVTDGAFEFAFEPIVDLKTGFTSHYEALTRFQPGHSPADTIQFAEDMGLTDPFDMAVAAKAFGFLERDPAVTICIAFNISARSIASPASFGMLAGLLAKKRGLAKRVLIEITESAELPDLAAADKAIQCLRQMGYRVGIDDFGAGAASLQYLHGLAVDFIKMDGALIQRLGKSPREDALLKSVLSTCAELGIETIAEWIDSPEKLQDCRDIGFKLGQGRHFGAPLSELPKPLAEPGPRARRVGAKDTWQ